MDFLHRSHFDLDLNSPAVRLLGREYSPELSSIILQGLQAGWLTDPHERSLDSKKVPLLMIFLAGHGYRHPVECGTSRIADVRVAQSNLRQTSDGMRIFQQLLELGADPWAQDSQGHDTLDFLQNFKWLDSLDLLMNRPDRPSLENLMARRTSSGLSHSSLESSPLPWTHAAVHNQHLAWTLALFQHGFDPNQLDDDGRTVLFYAQDLPTAQILLEHGVDPYTVDHKGFNAGAQWAKNVAHSETSQQMQQYWSTIMARSQQDPNVVRSLHRKALFELASTSTKETFLQHLKRHKFLVDERLDTSDGSISLTFSMISSFFRTRKYVSDLFQKKATLNFIAKRTQTAWHESVPGVPDTLLSWAIVGDSLDATRVAERYNVDATTRARLLPDLLHLFENWRTYEERQNDANPKLSLFIAERQWSTLRTILTHGLCLDSKNVDPPSVRDDQRGQFLSARDDHGQPVVWAYVAAAFDRLHACSDKWDYFHFTDVNVCLRLISERDVALNHTALYALTGLFLHERSINREDDLFMTMIHQGLDQNITLLPGTTTDDLLQKLETEHPSLYVGMQRSMLQKTAEDLTFSHEGAALSRLRL